MITLDLALKMQAYVDGELPAKEATQVARLVSADPEAQALLAELALTRSFMRGNEFDRPVPETREFYWSGISRAIQPGKSAVRSPTRVRAFPWIRIVAALGGAACLALAVFNAKKLGFSFVQHRPPAGAAEEVDNAFESATTITFRSEEEGLTVVWVSID